MRLAFMTFACPEWELPQILEAAEVHGYQSVELRIDAGHKHEVEVWTTKGERKVTEKIIRKSGIDICCLATSLQMGQETANDHLHARVDLAADLGVPALRVFAGPKPEHMDRDSYIQHLVHTLRDSVSICQNGSIQLWLETHDSMSLAADCSAVVRGVNHPLLGINYDNMHPYRRGESVEESFAAMGNMIRHCHFHDAVNSDKEVVVKPIGEGQMPVDVMFASLIASGFDGTISGEWFYQQYGETPEASIERYAQDMKALAARHGVHFERR